MFAGQAGQTASDGVTLPNTLDGHSAFMFDAKRDGSFHAAITPGTSTVIVPGATTPSVPAMGQPNRALTTSAITVAEGTNFNKNPATGLAYTYSVSFLQRHARPPPPTPCLPPTTSAAPTLPSCRPAAQTLNPIKIGEKGEFNINGLPPGMSMKVTTLPTKAVDGTITLSPANGDTINISPQASVFSVIDKAIAEIKAAPNSNVAAQASGQALANIDIGLERMSNIRSYAGELLNRADRITGDQSKRSEQLRGRPFARRGSGYDQRHFGLPEPADGLPGSAADLCVGSEAFAVQLHRLAFRPAQRAGPQMPAAPPESTWSNPS